MFCSACGKPLGRVAHIVHDQLICEDCYLKLGEELKKAEGQAIALAADQDLERKLTQFGIAPDNLQDVDPNAPRDPAPLAQNIKPQLNSMSVAPAQPVRNETGPEQESSLIARFLQPGESVIWKRSISQGVLHRRLLYTEVVTNLRAVRIEDSIPAITEHVALKGAQIVVTQQVRQYSGLQTGFERYGMYSGSSTGSSALKGNVEFLVNGQAVFTIYNVRDPNGVKKLIEGALRSMKS